VFIGALLLSEEIDFDWAFLGKSNVKNDLSFPERQK
jgi:hypothetical protein